MIAMSDHVKGNRSFLYRVGLLIAMLLVMPLTGCEFLGEAPPLATLPPLETASPMVVLTEVSVATASTVEILTPTVTLPPIAGATEVVATALPTEAAEVTIEVTAEVTEIAIEPTLAAPTEAAQVTATLPVAFANDYNLGVPAGVKVQLFRNELDHPSSLTFDEAGALYVGINNGLYPNGAVGEIYRLQDSDGDGWAESWTIFAQGLDRPVGLAFREGALYVSQRGGILRLRDNDGDGIAEEGSTIIENLPAYGLHHNNGLTFGPDGLLYLTLGSATNNGGPEEEERNGTILRMQPDGSGLEIFASGMRNPYDLVFDGAGNLFAGDNGCDPPVCEDAPEELNHIIMGANYGYPNFVGYPPADSGTLGPVLTFPTHTSANGLIIYQADMFPEWRDDILIAWFGSYLPGFTEVGRRIVRVELQAVGDTFQGSYHPFIEGLERPLDLTVAADGSIFVTDFGAGRIYRLYR